MKETEVRSVSLNDDGRFPNNDRCTLLLYSDVVPANAKFIEELFTGNCWPSAWRNGVFSFHHYHSTAHKVLGGYSGSATVRFGGDLGVTEELHAGDVVVIPAGVAHKCLSATGDFGAVGAYPGGQIPDMNRGEDGERPQADKNIASVPTARGRPGSGQERNPLRALAAVGVRISNRKRIDS